MNPEVLIIGGGVIGLSIARELNIRGIDCITLIEKNACGREASWAAAGMLSPDIETLESGEFHAMCTRSRDLYPGFAEALLQETGIDIELDRAGTLFAAFNDSEAGSLAQKVEKQSAAGLEVDALDGNEVTELEPQLSDEIVAAAFYPNDWQVDNRRLLDALLRAASLNGTELLEHTECTRLIFDRGRVIGADTSAGAIYAGTVVLATGAWTSLIQLGDESPELKITPVRGQMIEFRTAERALSNVIYSTRAYLVPRRDGRVLVGSTTEFVGFDKSLTSIAAEELRSAAIEIAPFFRDHAITDHWAGLRPFAMDGLPIIGSLGGVRGLLAATGHYRNGILLAPLTAEIIAGCVAEKSGPELYIADGIANREMLAGK